MWFDRVFFSVAAAGLTLLVLASCDVFERKTGVTCVPANMVRACVAESTPASGEGVGPACKALGAWVRSHPEVQ